jgi:catechol 2,3-dioxygenase-like lactoylglutathione lyase family enzyme
VPPSVNRPEGATYGAAGPIVEVTVSTPAITADVELWHDVLGYSVVADGPLPEADAERWGTNALRGNRVVRLTPPDAERGGVRLVEQAEIAGYVPLRTYGWAAIELVVGDLAVVEPRLGAASKVLGRPSTVGGRQSGLRAMQVLTPGGVVLYVTQISSMPSGFDLPLTTGEVGRVFIAVVGTRDLDVTRRFLEDRLRSRRVTDHDLPVGVLNRAFGFAAGTRHRVSSVQLAGQSVIEIDQYPPEASERSVPSGCLPPGVAFVTIAAPATSHQPAGFERGPFGLLIEIVAAATR